MRQQVEGLDHGRRRVVEALAVYGRAASFEALLTVTEASEQDLLGDLRSLVAAGVVVEVSDDQFWFTHALVADAIVHQLLGRERRRLHERCFEAVRPAPVLDHSSLARHAQGADRHDEVPAIARRGAAGTWTRATRSRRCAWPPRAWPRPPTTPSCWPSPPRRRGGWTSPARRWARRRAGRRWRSRCPTGSRPCDSWPGCTTSSTRRRPRSVRSASWRRSPAPLEDVRCRGVAAAAVAQLHMLAGRSIDADRVGRAGARRRPGGRRRGHRGAGTGRAGRGDDRQPAARPRRSAALDEALDAARRSGRRRAADAGDQQRLGARARPLRPGGRAAGGDAGRQLAGSGSTSWARRRRCCGSSTPRSAPVTCPTLRRVSAEGVAVVDEVRRRALVGHRRPGRVRAGGGAVGRRRRDPRRVRRRAAPATAASSTCASTSRWPPAEATGRAVWRCSRSC